MPHLHLIELIPFFSLVAVTAAVWLAYRMSEEHVTIGGSKLYKEDFSSVEALIDKVGPAEWADWLENHSKELIAHLILIGKLPLIDEIGIHLSRIRSFRALVKRLVVANQITEKDNELVVQVLIPFKAKGIEALSIWFKDECLPENEARSALSTLLKGRKRFIELRESKSSPGILPEPPNEGIGGNEGH